MKIFAIAITVGLIMTNTFQSGSFEKRALALVQRLPVSNLDKELPQLPFATWFKQIIGPEAGVVWQLTECGERTSGQNGTGQELSACVEANAVLPDGSKTIVLITVGTFKQGITGEPIFFRAVVERDDQIYQARRLRDLLKMLRSSEHSLANLPDVTINLPMVKLPSLAKSLAPPRMAPYLVSGGLDDILKSPPLPSSSQEPQRISEGVLQGIAITKFMPVYPQTAKSMNAYGKVEVEITISEQGRVIEARAISGHPTLRSVAADAARRWIYKPTLLNGIPVKAQGILTFIFSPGKQ
jgi:TonB family protein